eukprot:scaffold3701_cov149-Amphora_coffeaeformis.AAC.1
MAALRGSFNSVRQKSNRGVSRATSSGTISRASSNSCVKYFSRHARADWYQGEKRSHKGSE